MSADTNIKLETKIKLWAKILIRPVRLARRCRLMPRSWTKAIMLWIIHRSVYMRWDKKVGWKHVKMPGVEIKDKW